MLIATRGDAARTSWRRSRSSRIERAKRATISASGPWLDRGIDLRHHPREASGKHADGPFVLAASTPMRTSHPSRGGVGLSVDEAAVAATSRPRSGLERRKPIFISSGGHLVEHLDPREAFGKGSMLACQVRPIPLAQ